MKLLLKMVFLNIKTMEVIERKIIKNKQTFIFAIRKEVSNSGFVNYVPLCGVKSFLHTNFTRIIKVYEEYHLFDIDVATKLTQEQALDHIKGYITQMNLQHKDDLQTIEILKVEQDV